MFRQTADVHGHAAETRQRECNLKTDNIRITALTDTQFTEFESI